MSDIRMTSMRCPSASTVFRHSSINCLTIYFLNEITRMLPIYELMEARIITTVCLPTYGTKPQHMILVTYLYHKGVRFAFVSV